MDPDMDALGIGTVNSQGLSGGDAVGRRRVLHDWTVMIPTLGRPLLQQCLHAIAIGTVLPACIIVVDQGSNKDAVAEWLAELDRHGLQTIHLVSEDSNPGLARNLGIARVQTARVAAVDDDCLAEQHWLEAMARLVNQHPDFIVTGRVDPAGPGRAPTIVSSDISKLYLAPSPRRPSPLATCNMGLSIRTAQRIGPFDGALFTAEDNDWAHRALRLGIPILYTPDAIVQHFHWRTDSELAATYLHYAWGQGNFYGKHLRRGDWLILLMAAISLFRGARDLLFGWLRHDYSRRVSGSARMRRLLPGIIHGFLKSTAKP